MNAVNGEQSTVNEEQNENANDEQSINNGKHQRAIHHYHSPCALKRYDEHRCSSHTHRWKVYDRNTICLILTADIYGQTLRVYVKKYLRPELKFDSLEALKNQIANEKNDTLQYFSEHPSLLMSAAVH